jgi:hypothetical protein
VSEEAPRDIRTAKARLRLVKRLAPGGPSNPRVAQNLSVATPQRTPRMGLRNERAHQGEARTTPRLISPDDAIGLGLRAQAMMALALLTPQERLVLQQRFGVGESSELPVIDPHQQIALTAEQILFIEATALRKLRQPSRLGGRRRVDCG